MEKSSKEFIKNSTVLKLFFYFLYFSFPQQINNKKDHKTYKIHHMMN